MADDRAARFTARALAKVDGYIAAHPECTREGATQPVQGATNRVVFARRGNELVVLKVFCEQERKEREVFGLCHWRRTGLVPDLLWDADPGMIVMSHVPGAHLHAAKELDGEPLWREACLETGRALGSLTCVRLTGTDRAAFESRFYGRLGRLEAYIGRILRLGWGIHARDPHFSDAYWRGSLGLIESELDGILSQPRVFYHQDAGNLHVQRGRFVRFYDLEMCRVGCVTMQLASSLGMLRGDASAWSLFRAGWEDAVGCSLDLRDLVAAAAAAHLLHWREIGRYLSYDGTMGTGYAWASPADPVEHRRSLSPLESVLGVDTARSSR